MNFQECGMGERIGRSIVTFHCDFQRWATNNSLGMHMWMEFKIEGNVVMIHYILLGIVDLSALIPPKNKLVHLHHPLYTCSVFRTKSWNLH
jgi:hypothetical protein